MPKMNSVSSVSALELSKYINCIRESLLQQNFFEHTLYSSIAYEVRNTDSFRMGERWLRYGTEPDIWQIGSEYSRFFSITSLFRNEPASTNYHIQEFKVADYYVAGCSREQIVEIFIDLLGALESALDLPHLSQIPVTYVPYDHFYGSVSNQTPTGWVAVIRYPKEESFYDAPLEERTEKFELFYQDADGFRLEICSAGLVAPNLNPDMRISNDKSMTSVEIMKKRFFGLGIGIERLIFMYHRCADRL